MPAADGEPFAERAALGLHLGGQYPTSETTGPLGSRCHGPSPRLRVRRILVVDGQFVADAAVGDQLAAAPPSATTPRRRGRGRRAAGRSRCRSRCRRTASSQSLRPSPSR